MTVDELIELLRQYPPDFEVVHDGSEWEMGIYRARVEYAEHKVILE